MGGAGSSANVLIVRDPQHHLNISGGKETYLPAHFLFGVVPHALLDEYTFWQTEGVAPVGTPLVRMQSLSHRNNTFLARALMSSERKQ